jgi:hypothetical protein
VRFQIIEEALRRVGQFDDELLIEGVEVCLPIEAHNGDAVALFDAHIVQLHENAPSEPFFGNASLFGRGPSTSRTPAFRLSKGADTERIQRVMRAAPKPEFMPELEQVFLI